MKKLMGQQLNARDIDDILQDADLNGDGQVDFEGETLLDINNDNKCLLNIFTFLLC